MPTNTNSDNFKYVVTALTQNGDERDVAKFTNKSDAIAMATAGKYVNVEVNRLGARGEKTVYSHTHTVKDGPGADKFTHEGVKKVSATA